LGRTGGQTPESRKQDNEAREKREGPSHNAPP
jgi:hypothetical protein